MKDPVMEEIPLLKKISSTMAVPAYSRVNSLVKAVNILEALIKRCQTIKE